MNVIAESHADARKRLQTILQETRQLEPRERAERLRQELDASLAERKLVLAESMSLIFGGGTSSLVTEDPRYDDGEVWDETGHGGSRSRGGIFTGRASGVITRRDLDVAREVCRWLSRENEYVIGSMETRVSYTVGEGLVWRAVPRDRMAEDRALTHAANEALEAFREQEVMDLVEQEWVRRQDRDGEALLRVFANADGPPRCRFLEPEQLDPPPAVEGLTERARHALSLGVEVDSIDVRTVLAYWVREDALVDPVRVQVDMGMGITHVHHAKANVDLSDPRGWPTYWPVRRNMARAEKLLRNMSYVAALQAAIALIRKHENATKSEVEALLEQHQHLAVTNNVTGQTTRYRGVAAGTVIDGGPGVSYEAPVSSVNAANNVEVLGADLRAGAVAVQQPEFIFSGKADGGFANLLAAEGPHHKGVKRLQSRNRRPLRKIHWDALKHEAFWGRLDPRVLERYKLEVDFPDPLVRDHLQQTQRYQIMRQAKVVSAATWLAREGINPEEEQRKLELEAAKASRASGDVQAMALNGAQVASLQGIVQAVALGQLPAPAALQMILVAFPAVTREQAEAMVSGGRPAGGSAEAPVPDVPGAKPAPGSTPGGPGGKDMRGNPASPETAPTQKF
jgi:hypothetical protein